MLLFGKKGRCCSMFLRFPGGRVKALTFSYDDGVEQDMRLVKLLDGHGMKGTFNLNSGLFSPEGTVFAPGAIHRRMTLSQVKKLFTGTHEVAVHCLTHASLPEISPERMCYEIIKDRENLEREFGGIVRGMAYPFGAVDDTVEEAVRSCGIQYARTVESSHGFRLPQNWLRLAATCHHNDPMLMELADRFLAARNSHEAKLFYLWGHAYEFEADDNWQVIEGFMDRMAGHEEIWYATNIEICEYVQAWKQVYASVDGRRLHNPTHRAFWFEDGGQVYTLAPGETLTL